MFSQFISTSRGQIAEFGGKQKIGGWTAQLAVLTRRRQGMPRKLALVTFYFEQAAARDLEETGDCVARPFFQQIPWIIPWMKSLFSYIPLQQVFSRSLIIHLHTMLTSRI